MTSDIGGVPAVVTGSGTGDGWGGMLGLLLVVALLGGGGGFFGGREAGLTNEMLNTNMSLGFSNLETRTDFDSLIHGQFEIDKSILGQTNILEREIGRVAFESERNAAAIMLNQDRNTQRLLDWNIQNALQLRDAKINELERLLSEHRIEETIAKYSPYQRAVPAFVQANPYTGAPFPPNAFAGQHGYCGA